MTILVTGAAGFIGSHVSATLLQRGDTMVGLDNFSDYYAPANKRSNLVELGTPKGFTFIEGDIRDAAALTSLFSKHAIKKIIHLAAMPGIGPSIRQPLLYEDVNTRGTLQLLEMARSYGVEKFVLASTSSVYGDNKKIPFEESDPTELPLAPYPATKKACELLTYTYHHLHKLPCAVLRFFNVYGPRGRPDMTPWMFAQAIRDEKEFTLYDAGRPRRDWTFVTDIVDGVVRAADQPLGFEIFNLGRGAPVTMAEFVTVLEKLVGKKARWKDAPLPSSDLPATFADTKKAERMLGYSPKVTVEEGLERFWKWFKDRPV